MGGDAAELIPSQVSELTTGAAETAPGEWRRKAAPPYDDVQRQTVALLFLFVAYIFVRRCYYENSDEV